MRGISVASSPSPMMVTSPQPNGAFRWTQLHGSPALVCQVLEPYARHFFTTRAWRLGERTPDATEGWREVASAASVDSEHLVRLSQIHGCDAVAYRHGDHERDPAPRHADIVLSDDPSLALTVQTADCVPLLLVDRRTRAIGAAHAGWRGLAVAVPRAVVDRMVVEFGCRRDEIMVAIGPAIGACCYEVGEDVRARFERHSFSHDQLRRWFLTSPAAWAGNPPMLSLPLERRPNHWFFDGWQCAREQLIAAGLAADQIFSAGLCTASHASVFCSYRRDGAIAGRMAAVIRQSPSLR
jgi:polyphenol oxidase